MAGDFRKYPQILAIGLRVFAPRCPGEHNRFDMRGTGLIEQAARDSVELSAGRAGVV
jgi:hypothetical protein